jgi:hypothetical protein
MITLKITEVTLNLRDESILKSLKSTNDLQGTPLQI